MGLFSNNKKLCPICGSPTPRLFPTIIEDMPICKECDRKIDLPDGRAEQMSLAEFRQYMTFYEENQSLRDIFTETARYDFSFLDDDFVIDAEHRLFRLKGKSDHLVFEASCLKGFQIWEDRSPLLEGGNDAWRCYESDVPDRVGAIQTDIDRFTRDRQEFERMERIERMMEQRDGDRDGSPPPRPYIPEPRFEVPGPVGQFHMVLTMEHPYWPYYQLTWDGPSFHAHYPSIRDYLEEYQEMTEELYALSSGLMILLNPDAQELHTVKGAFIDQPRSMAAQTPTAGDTVSEIQKYKALLDSGVITEEEFTAKKRQLLRI